MVIIGLTKTCRVCDIEKPISEFQTGRNLCKQCRDKQKRNYRADCRIKNMELYGTACSSLVLEKARRYYELKRAKNIVLYGTARAPIRLEMDRKSYKQRRVNRKIQALALLGSVCTCCGEARPEMLTFDHINGDGNKTDRERVTYDILMMDKPHNDYRVLCWNCNMSLGLYSFCPHGGRPPVEEPAHSTYERKRYYKQLRRKYKLDMITAYGGKCQICGESSWEFLCIDHTNGGGRRHRKELGIYNGSEFYRWLKRQGYPKNNYQLLCFNCNGAKRLMEDNKDEYFGVR